VFLYFMGMKTILDNNHLQRGFLVCQISFYFRFSLLLFIFDDQKNT